MIFWMLVMADFLSFGSGDDLALGGLGDDEYRYMGRDGFNTIRDTGGT